jgi:hypothetical protein
MYPELTSPISTPSIHHPKPTHIDIGTG